MHYKAKEDYPSACHGAQTVPAQRESPRAMEEKTQPIVHTGMMLHEWHEIMDQMKPKGLCWLAACLVEKATNQKVDDSNTCTDRIILAGLLINLRREYRSSWLAMYTTLELGWFASWNPSSHIRSSDSPTSERDMGD